MAGARLPLSVNGDHLLDLIALAGVNQKRGAFDRNATPSGASGAVGGACSALVRADHSLTPIAPIARWLRS